MLAYSVIFTKIVATILALIDVQHIGANIYPYTVRSYILVFAFSEIIPLTRFLLIFVSLLWFFFVLLLILGVFYRKARRIAIAFACLVMLIETTAVFFIAESSEMQISFVINFVLFLITLVALVRANMNAR